MKKELFYKISSYLTQNKGLPKITEKESFIAHCFVMKDGSAQLSMFKTLLAEHKLKVKRGEKQFGDNINLRLKLPRSEYLILSYDFVKDKISLKIFETGWEYAYTKNKFYPFKRNIPLLCYSKHLYSFFYPKKGKAQPRIMKGDCHHIIGLDVEGKTNIFSGILNIILNIDYRPTASILLKHYYNTKDEWEAVERATGVKIAKSLRFFEPQEVYELISVMKNPNELQTLYKYLANPGNAQFYNPESFYINSTHISSAIAGAMNNPTLVVLIKDYIHELYILRKKDFTLKITSKTRLGEAHRRTSRLIRLRNVKDIRVDKKYDSAFARITEVIPDVKLINNKKLLLDEGVKQDHCVVSYADKINRGDCCIMSIPWNNAWWTLELGFIKKDIFIVRQCRGLRNEMAPSDLRNLLEKIFNEHNYVSIDINDRYAMFA